MRAFCVTGKKKHKQINLSLFDIWVGCLFMLNNVMMSKAVAHINNNIRIGKYAHVHNSMYSLLCVQN